jgi:DNA-binding PadR family transcriptional regulator
MIRYIDTPEDPMHKPHWHERRPRGRQAFGEAERGSVKYDILGILWDGPRHGYDIMLTIEEKRGYRPSPGSIYPALQMLEEADFLTGKDVDGKRVYTITDKGSELLAKHRESNPEDEEEHSRGVLPTMALARQTIAGIMMALKEIGRTRDMALYKQALDIMERTRRDLFSLLTHE